MNKKYKIASLFSGCGGLDLGFIKSGFEVVWANDFFKEAVETYKKNIGDHIVYGDITKIPSDEIPNEFDILLGGFPCQGFSVANIKRSMEDERNFLYKELLRLIKDKQPKYFVGENVKGLLSMQKGKVIEMIINDFKALGYKVDYKLLKASDYGVPQNRERVVIIGNRLGLNNPFPKKTHGLVNNISDENLKPYITVKDTVGHLAKVRTRDNSFDLNGNIIYNHIARTNVADKFWGRKHKVNQFDICDYLRYWRDKSGWSTKKVDDHFGYAHTAGHWFRKDNGSGSIPNPSDWWELKKILGFDDTYDKAVTELELKEIRFEQSLRINNWELPSDTITATGPEIHPNRERRMSVRECAIIQTFPNDFVFCGSLGNMYKQIGNAVPVLMAEKIAEEIKKELENYDKSNTSSKKPSKGNRTIRTEVFNKYYYFLKFAEDELLFGFRTKYKIKDDWYPKWNPTEEGKGISDFATGAERIVYSLLNGKGIGQPNSSPIGADLFFEVEDAFIHIDLKTVQTRNIGDYTSDIFVGNNQNSYNGRLDVSGIEKIYDEACLPTYYTLTEENKKKKKKICLTYFITILYEEVNLEILTISIISMPNGELFPYYGKRVLKAGKVLYPDGNPKRDTHAKSVRFKWKEVSEFELLETNKKRVKIAYFNNEMHNELKEKLSYFDDLNKSQNQ